MYTFYFYILEVICRLLNFMSDVELYKEIGTGREYANFQTTVTYKGRLKNTIDFVAAKAIDKNRIEEQTHGLEIQYQLQHENITKFYKWYQNDSKLFVVLEYCPGGTLLELLERDVYLPETVIRIFGADLLNALLYLHLNSYLFIDFDPRNILIDENGIIKLNDFTGAGQIDQGFDFSHVHPESICYLAPELLSDDGIPSFASDLYSLGCLLYRMATGNTPFDDEKCEQTDILERITNLEPIPIRICSPEFNDLVLSLLRKDPYKRPSWAEVAEHPFWKGILDQEAFDRIAYKVFPKQRVFESRRKSVESLSMYRINVSDSVTSSVRYSMSLKSIVEAAKSIEVEQSPKSSIDRINEVLVKSELLKPSPIIFNASIENINFTQQESGQIPIDLETLNTSDADEFANLCVKIKEFFEGIDTVKSKLPLLTFLIQNSKKSSIANNFIKHNFLLQILMLASQTKHPQISSNFLLLFAVLVRSASEIPSSMIAMDKMGALETFFSTSSDIVKRKAVAALGEVVTVVAYKGSEYKFPMFTTRALIDSMHSPDDIEKHYAMRTIANVVASPRFSEVFESQSFETVLQEFKAVDNNLLETYATVVTAFYSIYKRSSSDFTFSVCRDLVVRTSPTLQLLAVVLAAETKSLLSIKNEIYKIFKSSAGDLRDRLLLAICVICDENPTEMLDVSSRFFTTIEKLQTEMPSIYDTVVMWTADKCERIIDEVFNGKHLDCLQIICDAVSCKPIAPKIWTSTFCKKLAKLVKENNFTAQNCELILQIIHQGVTTGACEISIISELKRPLISPKESVRFNCVKIISDTFENTAVIPEKLLEFIDSTILPLTTSLLQDVTVISDLFIKLLSKISSISKAILNSLTKVTTLSIIFQRCSDNAAALALATMIVQNTDTSLENLVNARIIPCILSTIDKTTGAVELLKVLLEVAEKMIGDSKSAAAAKKHIKSISALAAKAPVCAATLLENPISADCFLLMINIFTPQPPQNEILIDSAFGPFSIVLTNGYKKPEHLEVLTKIVQALEQSCSKSQAMRLRLKGSTTLVSAFKKASVASVAPLKDACTSILKALK